MVEQKQEFNQLVRLGGADIDGNKKLYHALRRIKGVSYSFSNAVCIITNLSQNTKIGDLNEAELKKIEDILTDPLKHGIPSWMLNRRKDYDEGSDKHLISTDIQFRVDFDIKRMKKIKCYKGVRHSLGLPVRGQNTRSHFRAGKTIGVKKKAGTKKGKV
ncbi:30S ribosomal protein S13 [Candidatus Woesearchaeota archaeon]|nr:30S ribosomal protein S13 [Candidatus Woesearchaeota archaeon]